jgi:hypothetical protein
MPSDASNDPQSPAPADRGDEVAPASVPTEVLDAAKALFRPPEPGTLATLVFDSLVDEGAPREDHLLRFEHPHATFELSVSAGENESRLLGTIPGTAEGRAVLHQRDDDMSLETDVKGGEFEFGPFAHGLVRISIAPLHPNGAGDIIWTDWFRV